MNQLARRSRSGRFLRPWDVFDSLLEGFEMPSVRTYGDYPLVQETEKEYALEFDMPGLDKEDIQIDVENGYLTIKGYKKTDSRERNYSRTVRLDDEVSEDDIKAEYKSGVLLLKIPKEKKEKIVKQIIVE